MIPKVINDMADFLEYIPHTDDFESDLVFRGMSEDHELVPSLFRGGFPFKGGSWEQYESELIRQFERESVPFLREKGTGTFFSEEAKRF